MDLLILEDEKVLLDKYQEYLQDQFDSIETCSTIAQAKELIENNDFDIALIDYNLPDGNGLEIVKDYPKTHDRPIFVVITAYSKERIAIESLNLGVFRYLEKPIDKNLLIDSMEKSIEEAQKNHVYKKLTQKFTLNEKSKSLLINEYFISQRELEVLESILINNKNKEVAKELHIGSGTVRNHLSNIFQKLHIGSKDELKELIQKLNTNN